MAKGNKSQAESKPVGADAAAETEEGKKPDAESENQADAAKAVSKSHNMSQTLRIRKERMGA